MKVAALQLDAVFARVQENLTKIRAYARQAAAKKADLLVLPEFFTSAIGFAPGMLQVAGQGRTVRAFLKSLAEEYAIAIGGSYLVYDGEHAYNRFDLLFPHGGVYSHKKDLPTQFENCYYTDGDEAHILQTPIGDIGVALCWEQIRCDTLRRMSGQADFVLAGSCWWDLPQGAGAEREPLRRYNRQLALEAPQQFAKCLHAPVIHASHCGTVTAYNFPAGDRQQVRQLVGAAQVIGADGSVIARRAFHEGEGLVLADVMPVSQRKTADMPRHSYWIAQLPPEYTDAWERMNPLGREYYNDVALPYYKAHE